MKFFLGTHEVRWLAEPALADVPLFVSRRRLADRKTLPRAVGSWALDGGGFTELQLFGRWTVLARAYAAEVRRFRDEIGGMLWAAPQDWMCEPIVIKGGKVKGVVFAGTGLTVAEHQRRTVENFLELRSLAPDLPIIPVLQGWTLGDYLDCLELYEAAGVDLRAEPTVGVGTMCRRESTTSAGIILRLLAAEGLNLHGFGFKIEGLRQHGDVLCSADSLAWSDSARHQPAMDGHTHKRCNNCLEFALSWRERIVTPRDEWVLQ